MAKIVTYLEIRESVLTNPSCFALGEARRVADAVGATVYALATLPILPADQIADLAIRISTAGADRFLCYMHHDLAGPPLDITHGALLHQVAQKLSSILYLFPAGGCGKELGAPLAVRLGGAFVRDAKIELPPSSFIHPRGEPSHLYLRRWRANGQEQRRLDVRDLERPVIATLASGKTGCALGEPSSQVEMLPYPPPLTPLPKVISSRYCPNRQGDLASHILVLDARISETTQTLVSQLVSSEATVVKTDTDGMRTMATASPIRLHWIAPGYAWDSRSCSLHLAPDGDAGFIGNVSLHSPPLAFDRTDCRQEQELLTLLEQQNQGEKGMR